MFCQILVAVDDSEHAVSALAAAIDLALADRGRLTLIAAVAQPSPWAWGGPISLDELRRDAERYHEAILRRAVEMVPRPVPTTLLLRHGRTAACLLDEVRRQHYDLIVVASPSRGWSRSALFGALGATLERRSGVPVLAVPAQTNDRKGSGHGHRREALTHVKRLRHPEHVQASQPARTGAVARRARQSATTPERNSSD